MCLQSLEQMQAIVAQARLTEAQACARELAAQQPQTQSMLLPGSSPASNGQQAFVQPFIADQWS